MMELLDTEALRVNEDYKNQTFAESMSLEGNK